MRHNTPFCIALPALLSTLLSAPTSVLATDTNAVDYLSLARGVVPVAIEGDAAGLKVSLEQALKAIDGDPGGFVLTPKPGTPGDRIELVYRLPARTTFSAFAVPNVLETPSPSQTFFRDVEISGSDTAAGDGFELLGRATLATHAVRGEHTSIPVRVTKPVRWLRITLQGGLDVQRDKTFFEFSEIVGYGTQEQVPMSTAFSGKWKKGSQTLELAQDGARVSGCYEGPGDLEGTVSGNLLYATGRTRKGEIPSVFLLSVADDGGVFGVRSTNGAPFRLYQAEPSPRLKGQCAQTSVPLPGCGSVIHGIRFGFDSAEILSDSKPLLDDLHAGLTAEPAAIITVVGHTSSEGPDAYNEALSRRRAESVRQAMLARGIAGARIAAEGRGEKHPIADNATEAGRALNRRVEIACR